MINFLNFIVLKFALTLVMHGNNLYKTNNAPLSSDKDTLLSNPQKDNNKNDNNIDPNIIISPENLGRNFIKLKSAIAVVDTSVL